MKPVLSMFVLAAAVAAAADKNALDKPTLDAFLHKLELYRTAVTYKIDDPKPAKDMPGYFEIGVQVKYTGGTKDEVYFVSKDGQTVRNANGDEYNINHRNPFQANVDKLTLNDAPEFGAANAPVTIVEFGDLECPDCKMEAPLLHRNVPETFGNKVRVLFKDYPLESIHPWARAAAIAGRCVYHLNHEAFWSYYDWIYDSQDQIEATNLESKIQAWSTQKRLDTVQLTRCIDSKATEAEVNRSIAEGKSLGVRGTPTLFINGRRIGGLQWPDLQLVINKGLNDR